MLSLVLNLESVVSLRLIYMSHSFFFHVQGVVLEILAALGVIKSHHFWLDVEHIEEAIQNVLVCLEMVVFSVLQQYAYHVYPYSGEVESKYNLKKNEWYWRRPFCLRHSVRKHFWETSMARTTDMHVMFVYRNDCFPTGAYLVLCYWSWRSEYWLILTAWA